MFSLISGLVRNGKATGREVVLFDNGVSTAANMNNGHKIIESVTFTPSNAADTTGKMELKFHKDEKVDSKYKYTLSYNVRVTDKAYEKYETNGYDSTGDTDADHATNNTSLVSQALEQINPRESTMNSRMRRSKSHISIQ